MSLKQQVGVGCLMVLAAAVTAGLALTLGGLGSWGRTTSFRVPLNDAAGLATGARVSVRGVDVGTVSQLSLSDGRAVVHFQVDDTIVLRDGATATVRARSLLGEKYLALAVGDGAPLSEGSELPLAGEQYEVDELFAVLTPLVDAVDPELVRRATEALSEELESDPDLLKRMLRDSAAAVSHTREAAEALPDLTRKLDHTLSAADRSLSVLSARGEELRPLLADADRLVEQLDQAAAPLPSAIEEAQLTLEETRALIRVLHAAGQDVERIVASLEGLDRTTVHEILREEGVRVRLFGSGQRDK